MNIDYPRARDCKAMRVIWKEAFGDSDEFIDYFMKYAFSQRRSRCVYVDGEPVAALYWFDCEYSGGRVAYLYAVATLKEYRGRGICRALLDDTHRVLRDRGYIASMLVPGSESLFGYYSSLGYRISTYIDEFRLTASGIPMTLCEIDVEEYSRLRRIMLPKNSVIEEGESLTLLREGARFYKGDEVLIACRKTGDELYVIELLGDTSRAPDILCSLGCRKGLFHTPGGMRPFSMLYDLTEFGIELPSYFGLALD